MNSLWIELNHNRLFFFIPWSLSLSLMMIAEFAFGLNRSVNGERERCPLNVIIVSSFDLRSLGLG